MPPETAAVPQEVPGPVPEVPVQPIPTPIETPTVPTPEAPPAPTEAPPVEPKTPNIPTPEPSPVTEAPQAASAPEPPVEIEVSAEPTQAPQPSLAAPPAALHSAREDSAKGVAARQGKREARLAKILAMDRVQGLTNRSVVGLLRVSDATASRYLALLVARGQLESAGKGRAAVYH